MPPPTPQTNRPMGNDEHPINDTNSGFDGGSTLPRLRCTTHGSLSCASCAQAEQAQYALTTVRPADLMRPSNSQEVSTDEQGQTGVPSILYQRATVWRQIAPDSTHGRGCALVWAGLLPIIGDFFYECQVVFIPENGKHINGETQLGVWFATKASLTRFQTEMVSNKKYEVRVSKFGQKKGLSAHMTSGRFDYIPLSESMAVAVRNLLLYLGSGRDRRSSYRIYHDSFSRTSEDGIREYKTLFGMVRFPWSPEPHTATTARMINLTDNDAYPAPDLDWGSASWRHFCDSPLKDTWEEVRMRHFQYETYKVEEQRRYRPRHLPPSHTPPGSPPELARRPSVPRASILPADAGSQMATPATTTSPSRQAPQGHAPDSQGRTNGSSPADGLSRDSGGLSSRPYPGSAHLSFGISPFGRPLLSHGGEGFLRGGQTTSVGQHTSGEAGSSTAAVRTPVGTSQGALGTVMYYVPRERVFGQGDIERRPEDRD